MKLLRLATTLNATSAPYNQFSLGFSTVADQTYCSLLKNDIQTADSIEVFHGDGSVFKMINVVRNLIKHNNYDVVHIHSGVTGIILLIAALPFKISIFKKTIFTLHNSWNVIKFRNQALNFIVMLAAGKICTCGNSSRNSIPRVINYFIENKTIPIVNGFDNERIDKIKNSKGAIRHFGNNSKVKILCVGALNNTKNQITLLKALKEINFDCELVFLGDGANKEALIKFSQQLNSNLDTLFKGRVSRNLTVEHMLEADISISLSNGEGLPIAVLESMYAGCFLILSTIPPHKEISPPSNRCLFIDASSSSEVVSALHFAAGNIDSIRSERSASQEYSIKNFGLSNMIKEYMKVYKLLLKERG